MRQPPDQISEIRQKLSNEVAAFWYSVIETCRQHKVPTREYLLDKNDPIIDMLYIENGV